MKTTLVKNVLSLMLPALMAPLAVAQTTYVCSGIPHGVAVWSGGMVFVESLGGLDWANLCGTETAQNNITTQSCKALFASLLVAQSSGRPMSLWITNTAGSCAANPRWGLANGLYFWRVDG